MDQLSPAVVTPMDDHMGLDIARSLSKIGVPVYGIDSDNSAPGRYSKSCRFVLGPNPEKEESKYIDFLMEFGRKLGQKSVLFPLSDRHVLTFSQYRSILKEHYEFVMPDHQTLVNLTTKDGLYHIAKESGIPAPETIFLSKTSQIDEVAKLLVFPVILKPTESTYWHSAQISRKMRPGLFSGRAKVIYCKTPDALIQAYSDISKIDNRLVVQEVIPGEDSRLVYISFYLDRQSRPVCMFAGRKYRVIPTGFGSASYVRSIRDPELEKVALKLLTSACYQGLGGIEFKKDPRDDCYKLIEVNTRFGMWDGLSIVCGVDLPLIAYRDTLGLPTEAKFDYREGVIWVDWQRDVRAAIEYRRKRQLSLVDWARSLQGEKMWAIYSREDWHPGVAFTWNLAKTFWARMWHRPNS